MVLFLFIFVHLQTISARDTCGIARASHAIPAGMFFLSRTIQDHA